jgi:hypothetical protein
MKPLDRVAGIALAAAALAALAWGSQATLPARRSDRGVLRLAWSALPERIEDCRPRSAEELARLPQHMRQPIVCEGTSATYRLVVRIDGATVIERVVHGGGLRRDRRLYVLEELPAGPGEVSVEVQFNRLEGAGAGSEIATPAAGATAPAGPTRGEHVPPRLALDRRLRFSPHQAILVTYSHAERTLVAVQSDANATR